ncbi:MAG: hypothetical protein KA383_14935 [Phycisphaerae bacterium]|nr:hypothetical protein [Phycisphaerae bacterium]
MLIDSRKLVAPGGDAGLIALSGGGCAWVTGYCFVGDEPKLGRELAETVHAAVTAPDARAALAALNGSFWAALVSGARDRVDVVTDRFGTRPPYYALEADGLLLGEDFWSLCDALAAPTLSADAAVELLTYCYVLGEHTLVEQIRDVPGGTHLVFRLDPRTGAAALASRQCHWRHDLRPEARPPGVMVAELGEVFRRMSRRYGALVSRLGVQTVGVNLSGGSDSRTIACLLHEAGVRMHFFTSAWVPGEVASSLAVAQALGAPHTMLPFWALGNPAPYPAIFWALAPTTKFTIANHVIGLATYGIGGVGALVSGHFGDPVACGQITFPEYVRRGSGRPVLMRLMERFHVRWRPAALRPLLRGEHAEATARAIEHLRALCAGVEASHDLGMVPQVDLEQRQRRYVLRDYLAQRQLVESFLPLNDNEFIDFFARVPFEWLAGRALYYSALHEHLFVGRRRALRGIPINGERSHTIRYPAARFLKKYLQDRASGLAWRIGRRRRQWGAGDARAVSDATWVGDAGEGAWLADLEWLCDLGALRRLVAENLGNAAFIVNKLWALYTVARVSRRIQRREVPACG